MPGVLQEATTKPLVTTSPVMTGMLAVNSDLT